MKPSRKALLIFLRYPEPGQVKSRLSAAVGPDEAARTYEKLARRSLGVVADFKRQHPTVEVFVFYTPAERQLQIQEAFPGPWRFACQQGEDLGERMEHAIRHVMNQDFSEVLLTGTDLADLEPADLEEAFRAVESGYAALGPAHDGGFYLIGLDRLCPMAFQSERWGTSDVFKRTAHLLTRSGFQVRRLKERKDVDRLEDLADLRGRAWFNGALSIIIPTVKPLVRLDSLLRHLRRQIWPGDEILIITAATDEDLPTHTKPIRQHDIKGSPPSTRHAREGGHPGFFSGFPPKARGNDVPGSWSLYSAELCLEITPQIHCGVAPRGRGLQLNRGVELAGGNLLFFLHDDCFPPPNFAYLIRKHCARPELSLGCFSLVFSPSQPLLDGIAKWANLRTTVFRLPYGDQGLFCRRETYAEAGGFKKLYLMEDVDFVRNCQRLGRLSVLPDSIATSPERYLRRGILRASLQNHLTMLLYRLGVSDRRLYAFYYRTKCREGPNGKGR